MACTMGCSIMQCSIRCSSCNVRLMLYMLLMCSGVPPHATHLPIPPSVRACGQLAYFGPAGAQSEAHFASIGLPTPSAFNPADHFIDVVSLDGRDEASAALTEQRVQMILQAWRDRMSDGMSDGVRDDLSKPPPHTTAPTGDKAQGKAEGMAEGSGSQSPWTQAQRSATAFRLLAQRTLRENTRCVRRTGWKRRSPPLTERTSARSKEFGSLSGLITLLLISHRSPLKLSPLISPSHSISPITLSNHPSFTIAAIRRPSPSSTS